MIANLEAGELEAVGGRDDDDAVFGPDIPVLDQFGQRRQRHAGLGAAVQTRAVGPGGRVRQFVLAGLLDDPVKGPQHLYRPLVADRRTDLDGAGQCLLGLHRPVLFPAPQIAENQRVGVRGLGSGDAGQPVDQSQLFHHQKAAAQCTDVAQVTGRDDHPVGDIPTQLLGNLDGHRLLALDAQRIHRVGQVDRLVGRHLLHDTHAAVEIGIKRQHQRAVGDGLGQLRGGDLALRQKDDGRDTGGSAIGSQCGRGIAG